MKMHFGYPITVNERGAHAMAERAKPRITRKQAPVPATSSSSAPRGQVDRGVHLPRRPLPGQRLVHPLHRLHATASALARSTARATTRATSPGDAASSRPRVAAAGRSRDAGAGRSSPAARGARTSPGLACSRRRAVHCRAGRPNHRGGPVRARLNKAASVLLLAQAIVAAGAAVLTQSSAASSSAPVDPGLTLTATPDTAARRPPGRASPPTSPSRARRCRSVAASRATRGSHGFARSLTDAAGDASWATRPTSECDLSRRVRRQRRNGRRPPSRRSSAVRPKVSLTATADGAVFTGDPVTLRVAVAPASPGATVEVQRWDAGASAWAVAHAAHPAATHRRAALGMAARAGPATQKLRVSIAADAEHLAAVSGVRSVEVFDARNPYGVPELVPAPHPRRPFAVQALLLRARQGRARVRLRARAPVPADAARPLQDLRQGRAHVRPLRAAAPALPRRLRESTAPTSPGSSAVARATTRTAARGSRTPTSSGSSTACTSARRSGTCRERDGARRPFFSRAPRTAARSTSLHSPDLILLATSRALSRYQATVRSRPSAKAMPRLPAERAQLGAVERVAAVVAGPVGDVADRGRRRGRAASRMPARDLEVGAPRCRRRCCRPRRRRPCAAPASMPAQLSSTWSQSRTLQAVAVDGQRLAVERVGDEQRDELLGVLVGAVVVGAARDRRPGVP